MSIKALQEYTRISKYSRYIPQLKRRETWAEQIDRVKKMHMEKLGFEKYNLMKEDFEFAFDMMLKKRVLGSQRALQFGGPSILKHQAKIYNCSASYVDRQDFFQEYLYLLLCGCGVGFSVQKCHIEKLPAITKPDKGDKIFVIPDSIEGWADAVGVLTSSYFIGKVTFPEYQGYNVIFDYSQIRPEGANISWGGIAPGPKPLKLSLEKVKSLFESCINTGCCKLHPIHCYDINMHLSDAVLSGGVRRSATICLFSFDDQEMMTAKIGDWKTNNKQRARSNNSVVLLRNKVQFGELDHIFKMIQEYGEPGFIFSDHEDILFNPCGEVGLYAKNESGESGFQFCNLSEINIKKCKTEEDFYEACKAASIIGTIQASYTDIPYVSKVTKYITEKEALIGCSMTGMMDNPTLAFDKKVQRNGAKIILETNERIAKILGINVSARSTCVKPSGSASCLLGSSSGIHPHHSKRYFRRVQANKFESVLKFFELFNPRSVEESVWSANHTDKVITFLCEVPDGAKVKVDLNAIDMLEYVKLTRENWIEYGKRPERCSISGISHNVSNTCLFKPEEINDIKKYLFKHKESFAGISFLPVDGDLDYAQAPFTSVLTPQEILKEYGDGALMASGLIVDGLKVFDNDLWSACDTALGYGIPIKVESIRKVIISDFNSQNESKWTIYNLNPQSDDKSLDSYLKDHISDYLLKCDWVRRFNQFAERYCDKNYRRCAHLLKHVHNYKLWVDLKREYSDVPWDTFIEDDFRIMASDIAGEACSGGACETGALGAAIKEKVK